MNMPIGCDDKRAVEGSGVNNHLAATTRKVRHRAAACLAERGCKTSGLRQIETHNCLFSPEPSKCRGFDNHLAGMGSPGRFPAARAVAIEEAIERSIDFKRDLAA
jgi:hypothetical protein